MSATLENGIPAAAASDRTEWPGLIVIAGPTATGKSRQALLLAQRLGSPLLNADSRQVYREFDIGTAKPTPAEQALWLQGGRGLWRQDPVRVGGTESFQARIAGPQTLQDLGNTTPGIQPFRSRWRDGVLAALRLWRRLLRGSGIPFLQPQGKLLQLHVDAVHGQHGQDRAKKLGAGSHRSTPVREQE